MKQDNTAFDEYKRNNPAIPYQEWDNNACLKLAAVMIENAKWAYINARYARISQEMKIKHMGDNVKAGDVMELMHLRSQEHITRRYFDTELFSALTMGFAAPDECVKQFDEICDELIKHGKMPKREDCFGNYV